MEKLRSLPENSKKISDNTDTPVLKGVVAEVRNSLGSVMNNIDRKLLALSAFLLFTLGCATQQEVAKKESEGIAPAPVLEKASAMKDDLAKAKAVREQIAEKTQKKWSDLDKKKAILIRKSINVLIAIKKTLDEKNITTDPDYEKLLGALADLLGWPLEKARETINQLSLNANTIPDISLDLEDQADLAEGFAYLDMGIVITDDEKNALRREVGLNTK